jgi:hypothetical protein
VRAVLLPLLAIPLAAAPVTAQTCNIRGNAEARCTYVAQQDGWHVVASEASARGCNGWIDLFIDYNNQRCAQQPRPPFRDGDVTISTHCVVQLRRGAAYEIFAKSDNGNAEATGVRVTVRPTGSAPADRGAEPLTTRHSSLHRPIPDIPHLHRRAAANGGPRVAGPRFRLRRGGDGVP